jgi:hypothetical protein
LVTEAVSIREYHFDITRITNIEAKSFTGPFVENRDDGSISRKVSKKKRKKGETYDGISSRRTALARGNVGLSTGAVDSFVAFGPQVPGAATRFSFRSITIALPSDSWRDSRLVLVLRFLLPAL